MLEEVHVKLCRVTKLDIGREIHVAEMRNEHESKKRYQLACSAVVWGFGGIRENELSKKGKRGGTPTACCLSFTSLHNRIVPLFSSVAFFQIYAPYFRVDLPSSFGD